MEESHSDESSEMQEAMDIDTASSASEEDENQEQKSYTCDTCEKRFYDRSVFKSHNCSEKEKNRDKPTTSSAGTSNLAEQQKTTSASEQVESQPQDLASNDASITSQARDNSSSRENCGETKDKPFWCATCETGYKYLRDFNAHKTSRRLEKYKCDKCPKTFSRECDRNIHIKRKECLKPHDESTTSQARDNSSSRENSGETKDKPFWCTICEKEYKYLHDFKLHMKSNPKKKKKCDKCPKTFTCECDLNIHIKRKECLKPHDESTTSQAHDNSSSRENSGETTSNDFCCSCGHSFKYKRDFLVHQRKCSNKEYKCDKCHKSFTNQSNLTRHMKIHTGEKPYECKTCGKTFSRKDNRDEHVKICTKNMLSTSEQLEKEHSPNEPTTSSAGMSNLAEQQETTSTSEQQESHFQDLASNDASITSQTRDNSSSREDSGETKDKPFWCTICEKGYKYLRDFKVHMKSNPKKKKKCDKCPKTFTCECDLKVHIKRKECLKPHDESTTSQARDNSSLRENSEKTEKFFPCDICEEEFDSILDLNQHKRTRHRGIKPYKCNKCHRTFSRPVHLKEHIEMHTGEKPYECKICGETFRTNSNLNQHVKTCKKNMPSTSKQPEERVSPDEPTTFSAGMSNLAEQRETTSASEQVESQPQDLASNDASITSQTHNLTEQQETTSASEQVAKSHVEKEEDVDPK